MARETLGQAGEEDVEQPGAEDVGSGRGTAWEVFWGFVPLGLSSFGGPAAHLGYFRRSFVEQRRWLSDESYARLVALCQFLPGPGSSQVAFGLGVQRAGVAGGLAAFLAFTAPSFLLMFLLARGQSLLADRPLATAIIEALKLLAVVVVSDATLSMAQRFWKRRAALAIGIATAVALLVVPGVGVQVLVLAAAALVGVALLRGEVGEDATRRTQVTGVGKRWLTVFGVLFLGALALPALGVECPWIELFGEFYRAGALVFGGGHVVLPLLQDLVGDALPADGFLTGYAAAQAVPGPMFSFASYLGAALRPDAALGGSVVATLGIFVPGFLLVLGLMPVWQSLASRPAPRAAVAGLNASVVGLLLAALYDPIFVAAVHRPLDAAAVVLGLGLLRGFRLPVLWLVVGFVGLGVGSYLTGV